MLTFTFNYARVSLPRNAPILGHGLHLGALSPVPIGGTPVSIHLYVADVDTLVERATTAGATLLRPLAGEFFGDRVALVVDPFGHKWHLATRRENVAHEEMQRRMDAAYT